MMLLPLLSLVHLALFLTDDRNDRLAREHRRDPELAPFRRTCRSGPPC
jgi:hypothetical protein